jgi:DNA polymerase-1
LPEAQSFISLYERRLPFTKVTFDMASQRAQENGFIFSLLGRRARFPLWEPSDNGRIKRHLRKAALPREEALAAYGSRIVRANTYMALNRLLQLGNADQIKKAMADIWEAGICDVIGPLLLQVHDELDTSTPRTPAGREAAEEVRRLMEVAIPLRVPVLVNMAIGPNWGAVE